MKKSFLIFFILISSICHSQLNLGWKIGLNFSFGTHTNRIGINGGAYVNYPWIQVNAETNILYNFQSLGTRSKSPEIQVGIGSQLGFGVRYDNENAFIGLTENNMSSSYSVGYTYLHYWDKNQTSQGGGILSMNIFNFKVASENDLFGAGQGWRDRFRTGAVLLEYRYENTKFGINTVLWTGDYSSCKDVKDSEYPARFGYRNAAKSIHGNYSIGILGVQVKQILPFNQIAQVNIGWDSEKIRNSFQNQLIHDEYFIPESWIKRKPYHIPMLQPDGSQYLYRDGQQIRPGKFYFQLSGNTFPFY